ncbi:hypothetical protein OK074_7426 [Actinobacteria bacterium OK074]|nr:hypothetical protein OK074_7426 [Actinobacteria bacterium OK074]
MSSSPETSTHTPGARPAHGDAGGRTPAPRGAEPPDDTPRTTSERRPDARHEPYLDGLFTYCLSVLCDHDAATAALADVLTVAERRGRHSPQAPGDLRAWLYALARWSCLRRLTETRARRQGAHAAGGRPGARTAKDAADVRAATVIAAGASAGGAGESAAEPLPASDATSAPVSDEVQEHRRRELALLAWPEAAGTTPEQREALELAVRHRLAAHEVAAVLGTDLASARELLASAACEVERTRAVLAVVETGNCPAVARLTGDHRLVLSAALRRELVRHVDDCPRCRRTAERAVPGTWPGTSVTPDELPVVAAPRAALRLAAVPLARARAPRFDRRGFPMDPKDHAARRQRLRARAVTTTVVATVVAAPVLALWAAYRGTPLGEATDGRPATATEAHGPDGLGSDASGYENAGNASAKPEDAARSGAPDVSVEVIGVKTGTKGATKGAATLTVTAGNDGTTTLITLKASGGPDSGTPVRWSAATSANWLYFSRSSGTLAPGASVTVKVYVNHLTEPSGAWHARVAVAPAGAVVSIDGYGATGTTTPGPLPSPSRPPHHPGHHPGHPAPSSTPTATTPPPGDPTPTPTASTPPTTDPSGGGSTPPPDDGSGGPSPSS